MEAQSADHECQCGLFGKCRSEFELRCCCARCPNSGSPLHEAAGAGDVAALSALLQLLPPGEPLPTDGCGNTPLHRACAHGQSLATWVLLQWCGQHATAELSAVNCCGWAPAHCCAANPGFAEAAETLALLASCGADLHALTAPPDEDPQFEPFAGDSCLSLAAQHARVPQAWRLVHVLVQQAGLDPLQTVGFLGTSPLEFACAAGDLDVVKVMLCGAACSPTYQHQGIDVTYLLALAESHGCAEVAEFLLDPPPSFHRLLTCQLHPAETHSVLEGRDGSMDVSRGGSEDGSGSMTPDERCASAYDSEAPTVDPHEADWCLRLAIRQGSLGMVRLLVGVGGASGTHWRCSQGGLQELDRQMHRLGWQDRFPLLHGGLARADHRDTPLSLALREGKVDIAEWLLKRTRAAFPRVDGRARTALHLTARAGQTHLLRLVLETGLYRLRAECGERVIDMEDSKHYSALAHALETGHVMEAELLLQHGADVHSLVASEYGPSTPLAAALLHDQHHTRMHLLHLLTQHGAEADVDDVEEAVTGGQAPETRYLLRCLMEGGWEAAGKGAARLLLVAVREDEAECLEALLWAGISPVVLLKGQNGARPSLLEVVFTRNRLMWEGFFGYSEAEGRMGWQSGPDGKPSKLCWSRTRLGALRIIQALVLAGADAAPVVRQIEEMADAGEAGQVAAILAKPVWFLAQHRLWPPAFRAAVQALLRGVHRVARQLAAGAWNEEIEAEGGGAGQPPPVVFPRAAALGIVGALSRVWEAPVPAPALLPAEQS